MERSRAAHGVVGRALPRPGDDSLGLGPLEMKLRMNCFHLLARLNLSAGENDNPDLGRVLRQACGRQSPRGQGPR